MNFDQDFENQLKAINSEKIANFENLQKIKGELNELLETKSMLFEEICGKILQKSDFLQEVLQRRQMEGKMKKTKEMEFFYEEKAIKTRIEGLEEELEEKNRKKQEISDEISIKQRKLREFMDKNRYLRIEKDLKSKEKTRKFPVFVENKGKIEENLEKLLKSIGFCEFLGVLRRNMKILMNNLDDLNEERIKEMCMEEKILEELQIFFDEKKIDSTTQENLKENIRSYQKILKDFAVFRNFCDFFIFRIFRIFLVFFEFLSFFEFFGFLTFFSNFSNF